jgi:hypothetical protein
MSEQFHDESLKKQLRALSRVTAPQSALETLMHRVREGERKTYSSSLTFLLTVRHLFAMKVLVAVVVALFVAVPHFLPDQAIF